MVECILGASNGSCARRAEEEALSRCLASVSPPCINSRKRGRLLVFSSVIVMKLVTLWSAKGSID